MAFRHRNSAWAEIPRSGRISGAELPFDFGTNVHWAALTGYLAFDAYFQEAVQEKREEQYRVRPCKIYFYLEDDSIQVIEPRSKNTGIAQGNKYFLLLFYFCLYYYG
jgi:hypothetical protein